MLGDINDMKLETIYVFLSDGLWKGYVIYVCTHSCTCTPILTLARAHKHTPSHTPFLTYTHMGAQAHNPHATLSPLTQTPSHMHAQALSLSLTHTQLSLSQTHTYAHTEVSCHQNIMFAQFVEWLVGPCLKKFWCSFTQSRILSLEGGGA